MQVKSALCLLFLVNTWGASAAGNGGVPMPTHQMSGKVKDYLGIESNNAEKKNLAFQQHSDNSYSWSGHEKNVYSPSNDKLVGDTKKAYASMEKDSANRAKAGKPGGWQPPVMSGAWRPDGKDQGKYPALGKATLEKPKPEKGSVVMHSSIKGSPKGADSVHTAQYEKKMVACGHDPHRKNAKCAETANNAYVENKKNGISVTKERGKTTWAIEGKNPRSGHHITTPCKKDRNGRGCETDVGKDGGRCITKRDGSQVCRLPSATKAAAKKPVANKNKAATKKPTANKNVAAKKPAAKKPAAKAATKNPTTAAKKPAAKAAAKKPATPAKKPAAKAAAKAATKKPTAAAKKPAAKAAAKQPATPAKKPATKKPAAKAATKKPTAAAKKPAAKAAAKKPAAKKPAAAAKPASAKKGGK